MPDRRAVVVGSWQATGRDKPSPQRVRSITDRWAKIFATDKFAFRSLSNNVRMPTPLHNPSRGELLGQLADSRRITADTELLIHFLGHSVSRGENDLELILRVEDDENTTLPLSELLDTLARIPAGAVILILDTCHVGRTHQLFAPLRDRGYAMFATGDTWAYNADFSDAFLRALETPLKGKDQRIDRRAGGVTYAKLFQDATKRIVFNAGLPEQKPIAVGAAGSRVLIEAPPVVTNGFSSSASSRSIYGRLFELLGIIERLGGTGLMAAVRKNRSFLLESAEGRTVSKERIDDYLELLRGLRWIVQPKGRTELTAAGRAALDKDQCNRMLLDAIAGFVLPHELSLDLLEGIVKELLDDMIPPTPVRIRERAAMNKILLELDPATRLALAVLPATGRFLKGSADAIFPYEPTGLEE